MSLKQVCRLRRVASVIAGVLCFGSFFSLAGPVTASSTAQSIYLCQQRATESAQAATVDARAYTSMYSELLAPFYGSACGILLLVR